MSKRPEIKDLSQHLFGDDTITDIKEKKPAFEKEFAEREKAIALKAIEGSAKVQVVEKERLVKE